VIVLIHDRADGDVPGILVPLPSDVRLRYLTTRS